MKNRIKLIIVFAMAIGGSFMLLAQNEKSSFSVSSTGIKKGVIDDIYGKRGTVNKNGMPTYSLPLKFENAPKGTVSYAIVMEDKDSYGPTGGFAWIHWLAADITKTELKENESITAKDFVQGANSWTSIQGGQQSKAESSYYGGMAPPDAPHTYEIHVYALSKKLNLKKGFLLNELYKAMDGNVLASYTLKGVYKN